MYRRLALGFVLMMGIGIPLAEARNLLFHRAADTETKTDTAITAQTDTALWTPASGKRIAVQGLMISCTLPIKVEFEVSDTDVVPPIVLESNGTVVLGGDTTLLYQGATDAVLTYTSTPTGVAHSHGDLSVMVWGYEY